MYSVIVKSIMLGFCSAMDNMHLAREIEERQRYNALQMKNSSKETVVPQDQSDGESGMKNTSQETIVPQTESNIERENVVEKSKKSQQL